MGRMHEPHCQSADTALWQCLIQRDDALFIVSARITCSMTASPLARISSSVAS